MKSNISFVMLLVLVVFTGIVTAQSKTYTINGRVTSFEESLALEGVTVRVKGTQYITGTQTDGTFSIDITNAKQVLVFELQDYETLEVSIGNQKDLDVVLKRKNSTAQQPSKQDFSVDNQKLLSVI